MHHSFVDTIINSVVRSSVYHMIGPMFRGHGIVASLVIGAILIGLAYAFKKYAPRRIS
jgi:hypothetical protein